MITTHWKARQILAGLIGNLLEHFDSALFALMAPFLAPLFFEPLEPTCRLIITYAMIPVGFFSHPAGALFFGRIGDYIGRQAALRLSITGMALSTAVMGILPTYHQIGWWAPVLLALTRVFQGFFAAGENMGGAIYVLEHTPPHRQSLMSGLYGASTVAGYVVASTICAALAYWDLGTTHWRAPFYVASMTALVGLLLRSHPNTAQPAGRMPAERGFSHLWLHRKTILAIAVVAGCSYAHYTIALVLLNSVVPMVSSVSLAEMLTLNTFLLQGDMLLLPLFGLWADRTSPRKVLQKAAWATLWLPIPLFLLTQNATLTTIIMIRLTFVLLGVWLTAPFPAWAMQQVAHENRYTVVSMGYSLGSRIIGAPCAAISLILFKETGWAGAAGLYLTLTGLATLLMMRYHRT